MTSEWSTYRISFPDSVKQKFTEGQLLETVYHVAHVPGARRILEDGPLRAGIVYDESKFRKSRVVVTWLSANSWRASTPTGLERRARYGDEHNNSCAWINRRSIRRSDQIRHISSIHIARCAVSVWRRSAEGCPRAGRRIEVQGAFSKRRSRKLLMSISQS